MLWCKWVRRFGSTVQNISVTVKVRIFPNPREASPLPSLSVLLLSMTFYFPEYIWAHQRCPLPLLLENYSNAAQISAQHWLDFKLDANITAHKESTFLWSLLGMCITLNSCSGKLSLQHCFIWPSIMDGCFFSLISQSVGVYCSFPLLSEMCCLA